MHADERRKQLPAVQRLCRLAADFKLDRRGVFVAIGGGVCSDIVTVAASMIRRGVDHIRVPTTLIGQIDAGIGVKGAVNLDGLKSFVGTFHPPASVLIEPAFLESLPLARIRQGLSEILKMAVVRDAGLFACIEEDAEGLLRGRFQSPAAARGIIAQSIQLMLEELQQNPCEDRGFERLVDFGHTFSPVLEARSGFSISHGEAVAIDMALSSVIAAELGLCAPSAVRRFIALLARVGLPVGSPLLDLGTCREALRAASAHRGGRLNLVVPTQLGAATFVGAEALEHGVLERALAALPWFSPRALLERARGASAGMELHLEAEHVSPAL
jgi:3-dehydroquinate synthase